MCHRLDTIPACDGQTDGRKDILPRHSPRYAYASRGKNARPRLAFAVQRGHNRQTYIPTA